MSPAEAPDPVAELLALLNLERAGAGCEALALDGGLTAAAQTHSAAMSVSGLLSALTGGVVAEGRPNAQSAVAGWLADPADRAVLLDCSRTVAGIGAVGGWWTTLLA
jgi:uncharacterized protein YkwD